MDSTEIVFPVDAGHLVEILNLILTECGITLNAEPRGNIYPTLDFYTHTVRILDVRSKIFADITLFASLYELVGVVHVIKVYTKVENVVIESIAQLVIHQTFGLWEGLCAIVCKIVAFWLAMAQSYRTVNAMIVQIPRETGLGIQETILLINIEALVVIAAALFVELIVNTVTFVLYVAILQVAKYIPVFVDVISGLYKGTTIKFRSIRIVVFILVGGHIFLANGVVGDVGNITEVIAIELLERHAADNIPCIVLVVHVPDKAVSVLAQSFLAHKVGLFHAIVSHSKLLQLVLKAELVIIAIAVGVVQRTGNAPIVVDVVSG